MSTQAPEQARMAAPARKSHAVRTVLLVVFVVLITLFAVKNWQPVVVWPLGLKPLTLVIFIAFVLGALIGWLAHSLLVGRPMRREA